MTVASHHTVEELERAVRRERCARFRDRLRAVIWALEGRTSDRISSDLGVNPRTVRRWIERYNAEGVEGLHDRAHPGQPPKLSREQEAAFRARLEAGPREEDRISAFRGGDIRRILREEFGAEYSLNGVYWMLHRLGYSRLRPRQVHRKSDPEAMRRWVEQAPLLSSR